MHVYIYVNSDYGEQSIRQAHSMLNVSQENMEKRKQYILSLAAQLKEAQQV